MKIHHLSVEEALESMQSAPSGLTRQQAQRRLSEFGPNIVEKVAPRLPANSSFSFLSFCGSPLVWPAWPVGANQPGMALKGSAILGEMSSIVFFLLTGISSRARSIHSGEPPAEDHHRPAK